MTSPKPLPPTCYPEWLSDIVASYLRQTTHRGQLRLISALETLLGRKRWNVKTCYDFRIGVDRLDGVQWAILKSAKWDNEVAEALIQNWSPDDVFYDIGANIGYFTLLALEENLKQAVSFEPFAPLAELMRCNVELNGYLAERFHLEPSALGAKDEAGTYIPGPSSNSGAGRLTSDAQDSGTSVSVITLDSHIEKNDLEKPTIMKIDVEGGELDVLQGAEKLLTNNPPHTIVFEADCHADHSISDSMIEALLLDKGYTIEYLPKLHEETKGNYLAKHI